MTTIELTDVTFYRNGASGMSAIVGNDWLNGAVATRVARYTFTAPENGTSMISLVFPIDGVHDGQAIPIRYYIGTDAESHCDAGPGYAYTGELMFSEDQKTCSIEAYAILLPGVTYYLWLFPGSDVYGHYTWERAGETATIEMKGAAYVIPVAKSGKWWNALIYCVINGKWWLAALCIARGGKWYLAGPKKLET